MKIRNGFVSNSSSSSFVVAFPRRPKSAKEVQEILFGDDKWVRSPYFDDEERTPETLEYEGVNILTSRPSGVYPAKRVAETVWEDLKPQRANSKKRIKQMFQYSEYIPMDRFKKPGSNGNDPLGDTDWEARDRAQAKADERNHANAMRKFKGMSVYTFSYADEDGPYGSVMEHSGIFDRLPHETISNH